MEKENLANKNQLRPLERAFKEKSISIEIIKNTYLYNLLRENGKVKLKF